MSLLTKKQKKAYLNNPLINKKTKKKNLSNMHQM